MSFASISEAIEDFRAGRMLVESDAPLEIGEVIEVNLPHSGKTATKVVWTSNRLAGCQFEMPISPATLSAAQLRGVVGPDAQSVDNPAAPAAEGEKK